MWESLKSNKKWAAIFLLISILIGIALVPQLNKYAQPGVMTPSENQFMYEKSVDIMVMLLIGFGFLMVFVKNLGILRLQLLSSWLL
jgi:hypothetical protein